MTREQTLAWLAAFQGRFSASLRTPLITRAGELSADLSPDAPAGVADVCDEPKLSAAERIAVYNRQYWFRLLRLLHGELPLTSRLLGLWSFNKLAMGVLYAHPPRTGDLADVADAFEARFAQALREGRAGLESSDAKLPAVAAVLEAMRLDTAFRRVFLAPEQARFLLTGEDLGALAGERLAFSLAYARFEEHWPLMALRAQVLAKPGEHAVPCPAALPCAQSWALFRNPRGVGKLRLEPGQARLLALLELEPLAAALSQLEAETEPGDRAGLPAHVQRWLAQAVSLGFFTRR